MDTILKKSENVIFRKIEDEYILVPMVATVADVESIFTLSETGAAVWEKIDGAKKLSDIITDVKAEYESDDKQIEGDIMAFVSEMVEAKLIEIS